MQGELILKRLSRAEPYADRLAALIPGAGHIVHMPSHIYFRIGRFRDSIQANRDAVAADRTYLVAVIVSNRVFEATGLDF